MEQSIVITGELFFHKFSWWLIWDGLIGLNFFVFFCCFFGWPNKLVFIWILWHWLPLLSLPSWSGEPGSNFFVGRLFRPSTVMKCHPFGKVAAVKNVGTVQQFIQISHHYEGCLRLTCCYVQWLLLFTHICSVLATADVKARKWFHILAHTAAHSNIISLELYIICTSTVLFMKHIYWEMWHNTVILSSVIQCVLSFL